MNGGFEIRFLDATVTIRAVGRERLPLKPIEVAERFVSIEQVERALRDESGDGGASLPRRRDG